MFKPTTKITRTIRSEQVLNAFMQVVRKNLPLDLKNTRITVDDIIYVLAYANVHRLSIAWRVRSCKRHLQEIVYARYSWKLCQTGQVCSVC
jgi:hypothetical protein